MGGPLILHKVHGVVLPNVLHKPSPLQVLDDNAYIFYIDVLQSLRVNNTETSVIKGE